MFVSFDSRHAGYGDRSDAMVAMVITGHCVKTTVEKGMVVSVIMDGGT